MEIREEGGIVGLGNPGGRGGHSDPRNPGGRGGQKTLPSIRGRVDFFWNNPISHFFLISQRWPQLGFHAYSAVLLHPQNGAGKEEEPFAEATPTYTCVPSVSVGLPEAKVPASSYMYEHKWTSKAVVFQRYFTRYCSVTLHSLQGWLGLMLFQFAACIVFTCTSAPI